MATFFFCGIGGIGMSSIALYLQKKGHTVLGSDRSFDMNASSAIRDALTKADIRLCPQDGSCITTDIDYFVVTRAVEETIPDVKRAVELGLKIKKRPQMLADIFHAYNGIAIAGTSGKTSITAMTAHILHENGLNPTMINGGISLNTYNKEPRSNLMFGTSEYLVIEADESDGSIEQYTPYISVVSNISLDHYELEVVRKLFEDFLARTEHGVVINADCPETKKITVNHLNIISFSTKGNKADLVATEIAPLPEGMRFKLNGMDVVLPVIGVHNIENALAAIGVCLHAGVSVADSVRTLQTFRGTKRRLQKIGTEKGITVIDDYAHNPEKIKAALSALMQYPGHIYAIFQPHGFSPLRLMKEELIEALKTLLTPDVTFIMNDVFYAGGTVAQDIGSNDVIAPVTAAQKEAYYHPTRTETLNFLSGKLHKGDRVIVMGARDDSLSDFAEEILKQVQEE